MKSEHEIFKGFDEMMASDQKKWTAPVCHMTPMFQDSSDCETWWECKHCGHTKHICENYSGY